MTTTKTKRRSSNRVRRWLDQDRDLREIRVGRTRDGSWRVEFLRGPERLAEGEAPSLARAFLAGLDDVPRRTGR